MRQRYRDRITGPVRDRIDIHRALTLPSRPELARAIGRSRSTRRLSEVVAEARGRQSRRLAETPWRLNFEVPGSELRKQWPIEDAARTVLESQVISQKLSARSADRVLGLAWSVADLRSHDRPSRADVTLALSLRQGTPLAPDLRELVAAS
jgi:magnesium chelatase family protein